MSVSPFLSLSSKKPLVEREALWFRKEVFTSSFRKVSLRKNPVGFSTFSASFVTLMGRAGAPRLPGVFGPIPSATLDKDYVFLFLHITLYTICGSCQHPEASKIWSNHVVCPNYLVFLRKSYILYIYCPSRKTAEAGSTLERIKNRLYIWRTNITFRF